MLKAAEGTDFQIGACLDVKTTVEQQVKELVRMLDLFGNTRITRGGTGRPVVCTYTYLNWTPEELAGDPRRPEGGRTRYLPHRQHRSRLRAPQF